MLVSSAPTPSTTGLTNPRQIAVISNTIGAVMYTVPAGRKFVGYVYGGSNNVDYSITPLNGTAANVRGGAIYQTSLSSTPMEQIFVSGTIITCAGTNITYLTGVESDL